MRILLAAALALGLAATAQAAPFDGLRFLHGDPTLPLVADGRVFTVTWAPGVATSWPEGQPRQRGPQRLRVGAWELRRGEPVGAPRYRCDRYELVHGAGEPGAVAAALVALPGVQTAAPLYRLTDSPRAPWRVTTGELLLQLEPAAQLPDELIERLELDVVGPRGLAPRQWLLRVRSGATHDPVGAANALAAAPGVRWAQSDWLQQREARYTPLDDRYGDQWHLDNTGQFEGLAGNDINAPEAWELGLGSPDVIVAVLDSGVELDHPDLIDQLVPGWDFLSGDDDPSPGGSGSHGTRVAGVVAAAEQGIGVVGVCPRCRVMPVRMLGGSDQVEADSHDFAVEHGAWVINNSWGPPDGTGNASPIPPVVATAIDNAFANGRGGLGTAIFWAAGNGYPQDTCDLDGYVSYPGVIAVGASSNLGTRYSGSELCPQLDLTAPSGGGTMALTTTTTGAGYSSTFGGTSGASAVASGAGGLVLSSLPHLTVEGLTRLLTSTAEPIDPGDADYDADGHSLSYGYGRIDPAAALAGSSAFLDVEPGIATCSSELRVSLLMPGAGTEDPVIGTARSDREDEPEELMLLYQGADLWRAEVALADLAPQPGDGLLSVEHGDSVWLDLPEQGSAATVQVDCEAPTISDADVSILGPYGGRVTWATDEPADSEVLWEGGGAIEPIAVEQHSVIIAELEPCSAYEGELRSTDAAGNVSEPVFLPWEMPGDPHLIDPGAPEDADPCDPSTWVGDDDDAVADDDDTVGDGCREGGCQAGGASLLLPVGLLGLRSRRRP